MSKQRVGDTSNWPTFDTAVAQTVSKLCPHSRTSDLTVIRDGRREDHVMCNECQTPVL